MKTARTIQLKQLAWAGLIGFCVASGGAFAAAGDGGGGGGGEPPDYGDLFVLLRDADGVPMLTADACQQPLAAPGVTLPAVGTNPECIPVSATESCVIPVDPATCGIVLGYETYTQEVEFGRTNVARAPDSVFAQQLEDVIVRLSTADCVSRDAAGRMVTSTVTDGVVASAAIDSPIQNLAIYKQLMLTGYLGEETAPIPLPANRLDIAAVGMGAASDKGGKVSVDMVVYLNQILGLTDENVQTVLPKKCIEVKQEVMGVVQLVRKCFLDYGPTGGNFDYRRGANFGSLPAPAYIPAVNPQAGWFEYLAVRNPDIPTFEIAQGETLAAVPELADRGFEAQNIGGFAQAADDARAVIEYAHSWPIPGDYPTKLTCGASDEINYDVSISEEAGLQVPVRMARSTEREFTVTVANAGPDAASGTVKVTGVDASGKVIPTFPRTYDFTLAPGTSQAWTGTFTINYVTTVTWRAKATAEFDVNTGNNLVKETTQVVRTQ